MHSYTYKITKKTLKSAFKLKVGSSFISFISWMIISIFKSKTIRTNIGQDVIVTLKDGYLSYNTDRLDIDLGIFSSIKVEHNYICGQLNYNFDKELLTPLIHVSAFSNPATLHKCINLLKSHTNTTAPNSSSSLEYSFTKKEISRAFTRLYLSQKKNSIAYLVCYFPVCLMLSKPFLSTEYWFALMLLAIVILFIILIPKKISTNEFISKLSKKRIDPNTGASSVKVVVNNQGFKFIYNDTNIITYPLDSYIGYYQENLYFSKDNKLYAEPLAYLKIWSSDANSLELFQSTIGAVCDDSILETTSIDKIKSAKKFSTFALLSIVFYFILIPIIFMF